VGWQIDLHFIYPPDIIGEKKKIEENLPML
jgi:hypothetical protein